MKKKLMVVDDSRMMELQICKLLEDSEFEVAAYCENGEEAITRYEEIHPDVVTMDIIMPGIDGLETAQIILEDHPEARIVVVSALTDEGTVSEAAGIGAKTFLYKPLTREGLIGALEQALA
ncbi:MAG: response regulator [Oscillospiraceae bacterium]|jgi:two-component system chemotaxis response regulator CheY|nr:response regulator [Oscillospiraceae bacterium]